MGDHNHDLMTELIAWDGKSEPTAEIKTFLGEPEAAATITEDDSRNPYYKYGEGGPGDSTSADADDDGDYA